MGDRDSGPSIRPPTEGGNEAVGLMEPLVFTERPSYDDEEWSPTAIASDRRYRWRRSDGRTFILSIINNDLCPSPNPLGSVRVGPGSTEVTCVKWY